MAEAKVGKEMEAMTMTMTMRVPVVDKPVSHPQAFPAALGGAGGGAGRSAGSRAETQDELINHRVVQVKQVFDLSAKRSRDSQSAKKAAVALDNDQQLFVLEAEDGTTLFLSGEQLKKRLETLPAGDFDEALDLSKLRDVTAQSRGLGDWIWSKLSVLELGTDSLTAAAKDKALEYLEQRFGEEVSEKLAALAAPAASWLGAKALMYVIESRLAGAPGLYRWRTERLQEQDRIEADDSALLAAGRNDKPLLLFIHGTASHTFGSFGDLRNGKDDFPWEQLTRQFGEHVYGFEHHTFSQSPLENALEIAATLPNNARLSLVTHSRGGLVGDLLCLGSLQDDDISRYQRKAPLDDEGEVQETPEQRALREKIVQEEQDQLCRLRDLLAEKQFRIERYVRVAAPAGGTSILSENLDVFCSSLLSLMNVAASLVPGVGFVGSNALSVARRLVLEVIQKRMDPQLIPGLEAMLPDSPLTALLAQAPRTDNIKMAVIAGDAEGSGLLKRIITLFADWVIFDNFDNDLVVDSQSMRGGLARGGMTRELFVRGGEVSHLHYFSREKTRKALHGWLTHKEPETLPGFSPLPTDCDFLKEPAWQPEERARAAGEDTRPVLFYVPGLMGSHLELRAKSDKQPGEGNRIWFDPVDLFVGGIHQIVLPPLEQKHDHTIHAEGIFRRYYGDLADHLQKTFRVIAFPYDWREDLHDAATALAEAVEEALAQQPARPVSILAHSMGGLVSRLMIAQRPDLWDAIVKRPGGRFVMLGTPNNGSHSVVSALLGKADSVRTLARFDFRHDMQELLGIIAGFRGMMQLLPRQGFQDTGMDADTPVFDYFNAADWTNAKAANRDRWFGNKLMGEPNEETLGVARTLWTSLRAQHEQGIPHPERIVYVFGKDEHTACGLKHVDGRWQLQGTQEGDGSVTWASGRLTGLTDANYWYMPVGHADLTRDAHYFSAVTELLVKGATGQLQQQPGQSRGMRTVYPYELGPVLRPGNEELELAFFGGRPQRDLLPDTAQPLKVSVQAMDLRFAHHPVLCGHYISDAIAGTEAQIDRYLLDGALTQRQRLGVYASDVSTSTIVLKSRSEEDKLRGTRHGAIIVGLGDWNKISTQRITDTVRDGVLEYLLYSAEHDFNEGSSDTGTPEPLQVNSLLIGYNSTTHITVESSIDAVVRGVCEANQQFSCTSLKPGLRVGHLRFIEFYLDTAITAAYSVRDLPIRLEKELSRLDARVIPARELKFHKEDPRQRLSERSSNDHWPRLMVTDNDQDASDPCYQLQVREKPQVAEKLKYVFLSERARAEAVEQMRQPGLIEALIKEQITKSTYDENVCRTLFQLMIPLDFKMATRQSERVLLVLDEYTANLPWEMLQADEEPLALKVAMVRQLVAVHYRKVVRGSTQHTACVIGNPATTGFLAHYPDELQQPLSDDDDGSLDSLPGATSEAMAVAKTLRASGYDVTPLYPAHKDAPPEHSAIDVFNTLFKRAYRILVIAAHGVVEAVDRNGGKRSGVVLSDGVMITAAEVGQMEIVPDIVFLNCCHLGQIGQMPRSRYNRLAYGVSRELIEMGVRCVIAAGWAVDDAAAESFSTTFFEAFVSNKEPFGKAVFNARKHVRANFPDSNTWGAYQAYGDPTYRLENNDASGARREQWTPVAPQELLLKLEQLRIDHQHCHKQADRMSFHDLKQRVDFLLQSAPEAWRDKPDIQYKLGHVYAEWGMEGYELAMDAYRIAIQANSRKGQVPVSAIEQLSNIEVRYFAGKSEALLARLQALSNANASQSDDEHHTAQQARVWADLRNDLRQYPDWFKRVDAMVSRLEQLFVLQHALDDEEQVLPAQAERNGLMGGTWKRKAKMQTDLYHALQLKQGRRGLLNALLKDSDAALLKQLKAQGEWSAMKASLHASYEAYKRGENIAFSGLFDPYPLLNRLQLEGLLRLNRDDQEALAKSRSLALQAQDIARQRFQSSYFFFDAVMVADAAVALFLMQDVQADDTAVDQLVAAYREAIKQTPNSAREHSSVVEQLRFLSVLAEVCDEAGQSGLQRYQVLKQVADTLENDGRAPASDTLQPFLFDGRDDGDKGDSGTALV